MMKIVWPGFALTGHRKRPKSAPMAPEAANGVDADENDKPKARLKTGLFFVPIAFEQPCEYKRIV
jgi:hypothetical protein